MASVKVQPLARLLRKHFTHQLSYDLLHILWPSFFYEVCNFEIAIKLVLPRNAVMDWLWTSNNTKNFTLKHGKSPTVDSEKTQWTNSCITVEWMDSWWQSDATRRKFAGSCSAEMGFSWKWRQKRRGLSSYCTTKQIRPWKQGSGHTTFQTHYAEGLWRDYSLRLERAFQIAYGNDGRNKETREVFQYRWWPMPWFDAECTCVRCSTAAQEQRKAKMRREDTTRVQNVGTWPVRGEMRQIRDSFSTQVHVLL